MNCYLARLRPSRAYSTNYQKFSWITLAEEELLAASSDKNSSYCAWDHQVGDVKFIEYHFNEIFR